jgi:hypothetical protein
MALSMVQKGNSTIVEYYAKMKTLVDELASAGNEELVSYILAGFNIKFNPLVYAVTACVEPISLGELYT